MMSGEIVETMVEKEGKEWEKMEDHDKSKEQVIRELEYARREIAEYKRAQVIERYEKDHWFSYWSRSVCC